MAKLLLPTFLNERTYQWIVAAVKGWDIWTRSWTEPELDLIAHALQPGEVALDVGANFGLYTYHLSKRAGRSGRVYSFEPVPFTNGVLRRLVRLFRLRNVEVTSVGCSDTAGELIFEVPLAESGALATGLAYARGRNDDREGKEGQVRWTSVREERGRVVALDDYLPADLGPVTLLKCDIEGAEPLALRGARRLLDRDLPTVICEINPWYLEGFGLQLEADLLEPFFARGYELYFYEHRTRRLEPRRPDQVVEDNYVLVHPSRRHRLAGFLPSAESNNSR